ncbi:cupredoxin domain-containing protein [Candidatus Uhrbacteria bacterium]|nr:cupredoxin domain-containing protein [Candidatus Uhrbacteria bacterium]
MRNIFLSLFAAALLVGGTGGAPLAASAAETLTPLSALAAGDLIRGQAFPAVYYYGKDGFRYVFPNDKTYKSWYGDDFSTVKWISDTDLGKIQIGGNATYKPGFKMLKINSDARTYAVSENGELRWVTSESVAVSLYGIDWNTKIDDVPDAYFGNYHLGSDVEVADDFNPTAEMNAAKSIDMDKDLESPATLDITDNAYSSATLKVKAGTAVRFENKGTSNHTVTADDLSWGSGTMHTGDVYSRYFTEPGTYSYFCSYHPSMTAKIVVE